MTTAKMDRVWFCLLLGLLSAGCSTIAESPCAISRFDSLEYPVIWRGDPKAGGLYRIRGMYYAGFETGGFLPFVDETMTDLWAAQMNAYCVRVEPVCYDLLAERTSVPPEAPVPYDEYGVVRAIVRYEGPGGFAPALARNQCALGTITIVRLIAARPVNLPMQ